MIAIKTLLLNRFWSFLHSNILRQDETLWLNCSQFIDDLLRGVSISLKYTAVPARGGGGDATHSSSCASAAPVRLDTVTAQPAAPDVRPLS